MYVNVFGTQNQLSLVLILNTLIVNKTKNVVLVNISLRYQLNFPVYISEVDRGMQVDTYRLVKPEVYVLNLTSTTLEIVLRTLGGSLTYNPNAKFIILTDNRSNNYADILTRYFVTYVDVITEEQCCEDCTSDSKNSRQHLMYNIDNLMVSDSVQHYLQKWRQEGFTICFIDESVPPYSLYTVCPNCTKNSGLGFDVADMALEKYNISRIDRKVSAEDLSLEVVEDWLANDYCDLVLSPILGDDGLLDFIFPINDDELVWFVPSPSKVPKWKYLIRVFSLRIWLTWLLTISITALLSYIGRRAKVNKQKRCYSIEEVKTMWTYNIRNIIFTIQLFLEQGSVKSVEYLAQKSLMVTILLTTLAFNMIYKTGFTSLLLGPEFFEDSINSLEDIVDHKLYVSFAEWRLPAFEGTSAKVRDYFKVHNTECETISYCVNRMKTRKDLALLMSIENLKYDFEEYLDEKGHNIIQPIYPRFLKPLYGSYMQKGNPFADIMIKFNNRLRDHGFVAYILSKYNKKHKAIDLAEHGKLTMDHLKGPIVILVSGVLISFFTIGLEIIIFHRWKLST